MTAVVEVNIVCNGKGLGKPCPSREFLVFQTQSIKTARAMAARHGWKVYRQLEGTGTRHKDMCNLCCQGMDPRRFVNMEAHKPAMSASQVIGDAIEKRKR